MLIGMVGIGLVFHSAPIPTVMHRRTVYLHVFSIVDQFLSGIIFLICTGIRGFLACYQP